MPPPVDLTGRRFGKLVVIERVQAAADESGKRTRPSWRCVCDCGREETLPHYRIPSNASNAARSDAVDRCAHCRAQRVCAACGRAFESHQSRETCSDACKRLHKRAIWREHYYRLVERDPAHNVARNKAVRAKAATDPDLAARLKRTERRAAEKHKQRMATDPEYRERELTAARERYQRNADAIQARRRERLQERLAAMTPDEYEAWAERRRLYDRVYVNRRRQDPAVRERYRNTMREYLRQQALRGLAAQGDALIKKHIEDTEK